jgi:flagella basal body P-ring formation protein FlgA
MLLALVLACATGSDELVLKEKARIQGRFVKLVDLLEPARGSEAARRSVADVWLGRSPRDGEVRRIGADEIRRELERRGLDPDAFTLVGREVAVEAGPEPEAEALRRSVAFEIKRLILEREGVRADELSVRVAQIHPEPPAGAGIVAVREDGPGFVAAFAGGAESRVLAQVLRVKDVVVAARDIAAGKSLERLDVELRRLETDGSEGHAGALEEVLGSSAAVKIRKGAAVAAADLKLKPAIRRGDVVRLVSAAYEVDARAAEDGALGREIEVEIAASKARVRGRVAAAGRVEAQ